MHLLMQISSVVSYSSLFVDCHPFVFRHVSHACLQLTVFHRSLYFLPQTFCIYLFIVFCESDCFVFVSGLSYKWKCDYSGIIWNAATNYECLTAAL